MNTRSGWLGRKEVVEVVYDAKVTSLEELFKASRCVRKPTTVFVYDEKDLKIARRFAGKDAKLTDERARDAKPSDQKFYLRRTPYWFLPMTEIQAARINALLAAKKDPRPLLSPRQHDLLPRIQKVSRARQKQLRALTPARTVADFAGYTEELRRLLE